MDPIRTDTGDPAHDFLSRDPFFHDMAVPIAGGLAFATVPTLGLAPVLYATSMRVPSPSTGATR